MHTTFAVWDSLALGDIPKLVLLVLSVVRKVAPASWSV